MTDDERAELIAAALRGELTDHERRRLDSLREVDPSIDVELADLGAIVARVASLGTWDGAAPGPELRDRVVGAAAVDAGSAMPAPRRASRGLLIGGAAACLALGAVGAVAVDAVATRPVVGPPGTLGAVESIRFSDPPEGVSIDAALVAHTWGTETVLEIEGLPTGSEYTVRLVDEAGAQVPSGGFVGSAVTVDCHLNAALDRADLAAVEIIDDEGRVLTSAPVVDVS